MMKNLAVVSCVAAVLALGARAQATLLVYDGFNYPTGALSGDNGGTGWNGAWGGANIGSNVVAPIGSVGNSVVGNAVQGGDFTALGSRSFAATYDAGANYPDGPGVPYYFSFLVNFASGTFDFGGTITAGLTTGGNPVAINFAGDAPGPTGTVNMSIDGDPSGDTVSLNAGTTYLIAAEFNAVFSGPFAEKGQLSVSAYSDPSTIPASTPATWQLSYLDSDPGGFATYNATNLNGFSAPYSASDGDISLDEIRVGTTFSDVAAAGVPEPACLGLTCLAAGLLLQRRRAH
jgi:hypothetical protein